MDDKKLEPRSLARPSAFASQSATVSPARVRPARPIRFTPSRTDPIEPPSLEQTTAPPRSLVAQVGAWALIAVGWGVFIAWWAIVLQRESLRSLGVAVGVLAATLATSAVAMSLWTRHNIRIARKGKRGTSSLYIPMQWERDTLGRPLELPASDIARTAPELRVVMQGGVKTYVVVDAEEL